MRLRTALDAKKAVAFAISSATPIRPERYFIPSHRTEPSSATTGSSSRLSRGSGLVGPGTTTFAVMKGDPSCAIPFVKAMSAAFAAAYVAPPPVFSPPRVPAAAVSRCRGLSHCRRAP